MRETRRGITIIELLVFIAIFSTVMVGFITMFIAITRVQSRQSSSSEVESQGQFILQQIQYYVASSRLIDLPQDTSSSYLRLRESAASSSLDPTSITLATGTLYLQQGTGGALVPLTSAKVSVSSLSFTRHFNRNVTSSAYGTDSLSYSFIMQWSGTNATQLYSQTFQSSVAVAAQVGKIALLQQAKSETAGSGITSLSAVYGTANATGSLLIAVVANTGTSGAVVTVSSTADGAWTKLGTPTYSGNNNSELNIFDFPNSVNATNTVNVSFNTSVTSPTVYIYEYRGAATASSFDASSTFNQTSTGTPTSGFANPAAGPELVLGVLYSNPFTETPNAGAGFTIESTSSVSQTVVEDEDVFVTGSVAATWAYPTLTPTSTAAVFTFK